MTIKGRVGNAAVVENLEGHTNINQDVALMRLKPGIHPYYIVGYLNSQVGKLLTEQLSTGQINPFLRLGSLQQIQIPLFEPARMNALGELIKTTIGKAHEAQTNAAQLLEEAKQRVEAMILAGGDDASVT